MSIVDTLKRGRALIASGWSEPFCRDAKGCICGPSTEDVERYSVHDALAHAAGSDHVNLLGAVEALESVVTPKKVAYYSFLRAHDGELSRDDFLRLRELARSSLEEPWLEQWLEAKGRHQAAVLRAFDVAILRASAWERATRGSA